MVVPLGSSKSHPARPPHHVTLCPACRHGVSQHQTAGRCRGTIKDGTPCTCFDTPSQVRAIVRSRARPAPTDELSPILDREHYAPNGARVRFHRPAVGIVRAVVHTRNDQISFFLSATTLRELHDELSLLGTKGNAAHDPRAWSRHEANCADHARAALGEYLRGEAA